MILWLLGEFLPYKEKRSLAWFPVGGFWFLSLCVWFTLSLFLSPSHPFCSRLLDPLQCPLSAPCSYNMNKSKNYFVETHPNSISVTKQSAMITVYTASILTDQIRHSATPLYCGKPWCKLVLTHIFWSYKTTSRHSCQIRLRCGTLIGKHEDLYINWFDFYLQSDLTSDNTC